MGLSLTEWRDIADTLHRIDESQQRLEAKVNTLVHGVLVENAALRTENESFRQTITNAVGASDTAEAKGRAAIPIPNA